MTLIDLLNIADKGYGDGTIADHFDPDTGDLRPDQGDTLAEFVVIELSETFDPDASDDNQINEAIRVMESARDDIENVITALINRG